MGSKMTSIAGILFALAFVTVFILGWGQATKSLRLGASDIDSLYKAEVPFDITLLDGRWVTGDTIANLETHFAATAGVTGFRPTIVGAYITSDPSDSSSYVSYKLELGRNPNNGVIDKLTIVDSKVK